MPTRNFSSSKLHIQRPRLSMPESNSFRRDCRLLDTALHFSRPTMYVQFRRTDSLGPIPCLLANRWLALGKLREELCDLPIESKARSMLIINVVTVTISIVAVLLRLLSRFLVSKRIWIDDGIIVSAMVSPFSARLDRKALTMIDRQYCSCCDSWLEYVHLPEQCMLLSRLMLLSVQLNGLGMHIWDVSITKIPKLLELCMTP